jgi:hypothetical protein
VRPRQPRKPPGRLIPGSHVGRHDGEAAGAIPVSAGLAAGRTVPLWVEPNDPHAGASPQA